MLKTDDKLHKQDKGFPEDSQIPAVGASKLDTGVVKGF